MAEGAAAFFSYCREDSDFALQLAGGLKDAGASVWLDQLDIIPGQQWDRAIENALKNCPLVIVILSPSSVESTNVMDEVSFALEEHKTVIQIIYKDCEIPFRFRRLQHVDFKQDYAHGFQGLLKVLTQSKDTFSNVRDQIRTDIPVTGEHGTETEWVRLDEKRQKVAEQARVEVDRNQTRGHERRSGFSIQFRAAKIGAAVFANIIVAFLLYWRLAPHTSEQTQESQKREHHVDATTTQVKTWQGLGKRLFGFWTNDNPQTHGIKKFEIWQNGDVVLVRVWAIQDSRELIGGILGGGKGAAIAAGAGTPIDWGTKEAILGENSATCVWDQDSVARKMTITPDGGRLQVVVDNTYRDNRPPRRLQEYFVRSE